MGASVFTRCKQCGEEFWAMHGGGFFRHLLHCDKCGREKSIGFDELGKIHLRYLKGLKGPYSVVSMKHDAHVREHLALEPIAEVDYHRMIELYFPLKRLDKKEGNGFKT